MRLKNDPIKQHIQRTLAKKQGQQHEAGKPVTGNAYDLHLAQLSQHKRQLKTVESHTEKAKLKAKLLPEYDNYINGILAADKGGQDNVLINMLVWNIDAGNVEQSFKLANYAIKHKLVMPEGFKSSVAGFFVEASCELLLKDAVLIAEKSDFIKNLFEQFKDADMYDQVKAKLYRLLGESLEKSTPEDALLQFKTALIFDDNVGVKGRIKVLEKQLEMAEKDKAQT